jgi:acyl-CoA synthetase (AMP-forming)/AMP-acid ligase II
MLSHRNIIANTLQVTAGEEFLSNKPTKDNPDGDSILAFLPFFHIYGLTVIIHHAMYRGLKCVVMAKFDFEGWCKAVQEHKITMGYVVPPVVLLLAKSPVVDKYNLSTLKMLNSGAAPLTKELTFAAYDRTGVPIKQGYGLSETSPTTHMQTIDTW